MSLTLLGVFSIVIYFLFKICSIYLTKKIKREIFLLILVMLNVKKFYNINN